MDLEIVTQSQSERKKQILHNIAYMWTLEKMTEMNLCAKQKYSHRYTEQIHGYQGGWDELGDWDRHIYTTVY